MYKKEKVTYQIGSPGGGRAARVQGVVMVALKGLEDDGYFSLHKVVPADMILRNSGCVEKRRGIEFLHGVSSSLRDIVQD